MLSPGGQLFEMIASESSDDGEADKVGAEGKIWIIENAETKCCRFLARRSGQIVQCDSLAQILEAVSDESLPGPLPKDQLGPGEEARLLA